MAVSAKHFVTRSIEAMKLHLERTNDLKTLGMRDLEGHYHYSIDLKEGPCEYWANTNKWTYVKKHYTGDIVDFTNFVRKRLP